MSLNGSWAARLCAGISLLAIATPATTSETVTYGYDARGRLVTVARTGSVNNGVTANYNYDNANNRTSVATTTAGPPQPSFSINDVTVTEGGSAVFTVTKAGSASGSLSVTVSTSDGSAKAGTDYTSKSAPLTFASTDTSKTVSVATINNGIVDGSRVFYANLSNPSPGSLISDLQGAGTINDDEVAVIPSFKVSDVSANEGTGLTFTVTKTGATGLTYTINYATANGTATAGSDYTAASGSLTFAGTDTTRSVTIATTSDTTPENDETILLNLSAASGGATVSDAQGVGTIVNNDGVGISIGNGSGIEGDIITVYVTKVGSTASTITVNFATANGTAVAPGDYTAASGTLTFNPGDTSKFVNLQTTRLGGVEGIETFYVNLTKGTGTYALMKSSATVTLDDYTPPCGITC